jgi:hypothetical protein
MQHGQLLLSLQQAPSSLERLLAVTKLSVTLLADLMRRSDDTQDIPLLLLGHHYLSHRVLGKLWVLQQLRSSTFEAAIPIPSVLIALGPAIW